MCNRQLLLERKPGCRNSFIKKLSHARAGLLDDYNTVLIEIPSYGCPLMAR
jgi:hypothetical protein